MKTRFTLLATLAVLMAATSAHATCPNAATNYPACDNHLTPSPAPATPSKSTSSANSKSDSNSAAHSTSGSLSNSLSGANAAGGKSNANASTGPVNASTGPVNATGGTGGSSKAISGPSSATGGQSTGGSSNAATGPVNAAGGAGGAGGLGGSGGTSTVNAPSNANSQNSLGPISAGNDTSSSSFRSYALALPSPVFTPPLPLSSCPQANVDQMAVAAGLGLFSYAKGTVNTDNCTAIIIYNAMLEQCKFASAQRVLNALSARVVPGFVADPISWIDLTPTECVALKKPVIVLPPAPAAIFLPPAASAPSVPVVVPTCAVAPVVPAKKPSKGKPKTAVAATSCKIT